MGTGASWRRWIWDGAGDAVRRTAAALGGEVRPSWTGWQVRRDGVRVGWTGGLRGPRTRLVVREGRRRRVRRWDGLVGEAEVLEALAELRAG